MGFDPSMHFTDVSHVALLADDWKPNLERFYCLYCISHTQDGLGWYSESTVKSHVNAVHGVDFKETVRGVDYTDGEGVWLALEAFRSHAEDLARRTLGRKLRFCLDADDFVAYCEEADRLAEV